MADHDPRITPGDNSPAYDQDYAGWLSYQIELMKSDRWSEVDKANFIDEVQSLEQWSFDAFVTSIKVVVRQMMMWDWQEDERNQRWAELIELDRALITQELKDSPSYFDRREEALAEAYHLARFEMSQEDKVPFRVFPESCPYSWEDVLGREHPLTREPVPKFVSYQS